MYYITKYIHMYIFIIRLNLNVNDIFLYWCYFSLLLYDANSSSRLTKWRRRLTEKFPSLSYDIRRHPVLEIRKKWNETLAREFGNQKHIYRKFSWTNMTSRSPFLSIYRKLCALYMNGINKYNLLLQLKSIMCVVCTQKVQIKRKVKYLEKCSWKYCAFGYVCRY